MSSPAVSPFEPVDFERPRAWGDVASIGSRFAAKALDTFVTFATFAPGVAGVALAGDPDDPASSPILLLGVLVTMGLIAGLVGVQWYLLANDGQTLGKRWVGIRIVKEDRTPVDFVTAVVLRTWVIGFVTGLANQVCLGWVVTLADVLPIFGDGHRCLHDRIAGTVVVDA